MTRHGPMASRILIALLLAAFARTATAGEPVLSLGDRPPGFFLPAVNHVQVGTRRVVLDDYFKPDASKAVVISFFATWCGPCKKELPLLQKLYTRYREQGLRVVVVSIDKEKEAVDGLNAFVDEFGLTYPVVSDRFNLLARRYLGTASKLPSLFIADGEGKLVTIKQGYGDDAAAFLEQEIRRVLGIEAGAETVSAPKGAAGPSKN